MLRGEPSALELAEDALAVAERVGDAFGAVNSRINIASAHAMRGSSTAPDPEEILEIVDDAIAIGAAEEAYRALANFLWNAARHIPVDDVVRIHEEWPAS